MTGKINPTAPGICKSFHAVTLKQSQRLKGYFQCNYTFADSLIIIARSLCWDFFNLQNQYWVSQRGKNSKTTCQNSWSLLWSHLQTKTWCYRIVHVTRRTDLSRNSDTNIIFSDKISTLASYPMIVCILAFTLFSSFPSHRIFWNPVECLQHRAGDEFQTFTASMQSSSQYFAIVSFWPMHLCSF